MLCRLYFHFFFCSDFFHRHIDVARSDADYVKSDWLVYFLQTIVCTYKHKQAWGVCPCDVWCLNHLPCNTFCVQCAAARGFPSSFGLATIRRVRGNVMYFYQRKNNVFQTQKSWFSANCVCKILWKFCRRKNSSGAVNLFLGTWNSLKYGRLFFSHSQNNSRLKNSRIPKQLKVFSKNSSFRQILVKHFL